jgi:hypothetical protein
MVTFTRHAPTAWGVTEPGHACCCNGLRTVMRKPRAVAPFVSARCATLHCRTMRRRVPLAGKNEPNRLEP